MPLHFWRSKDTLKVPMALFRENRERLVSRLCANDEVSAEGTFVVLQGGMDVPFNDTDVNWPFRQVRTHLLLRDLASLSSRAPTFEYDNLHFVYARYTI